MLIGKEPDKQKHIQGTQAKATQGAIPSTFSLQNQAKCQLNV